MKMKIFFHSATTMLQNIPTAYAKGFFQYYTKIETFWTSL
ncbi:hypothetical protein CPK_ORF00654 [Chlamydia pneumoniae LPCoLN]|nr:hypothetical protein CPK_ORF00654 [Chlamydia pneumoniae LPCoLN]